MNYIIRKREKRDCREIAHVVTTYRWKIYKN